VWYTCTHTCTHTHTHTQWLTTSAYVYACNDPPSFSSLTLSPLFLSIHTHTTTHPHTHRMHIHIHTGTHPHTHHIHTHIEVPTHPHTHHLHTHIHTDNKRRWATPAALLLFSIIIIIYVPQATRGAGQRLRHHCFHPLRHELWYINIYIRIYVYTYTHILMYVYKLKYFRAHIYV
jgi:hypothetical protein